MVFPLYILSDESTVRFGVFALGMSLFIFFNGFESYYYLMNATVNYKEGEQRKIDSYNFFFMNWLLTIIPTICLLQYNGLPIKESLACVLIYISEHIFHEEYRFLFSTEGSDKRGIKISLIKSLFVAISLLAIWTIKGNINFTDILLAWLLPSISFAAILLRVKKIDLPKPSATIYKKVMKNDWIHFLDGWVAFISFQVEKIISIEVLDIGELATMFRVVGVGSICTQLITLSVFNVSISRSFKLIREKRYKEYQAIVLKNAGKTILVGIFLALGIELARNILIYYGVKSVNIPGSSLIAAILLITILKSFIDFAAIPIKAKNKEKYLVFILTACLSLAIPLMTYSGTYFGLTGILFASFLISCMSLLSVLTIGIRLL